jgi:hypothetical protein
MKISKQVAFYNVVLATSKFVCDGDARIMFDLSLQKIGQELGLLKSGEGVPHYTVLAQKLPVDAPAPVEAAPKNRAERRAKKKVK